MPAFTLPNIILTLKELLTVWLNQIIYHNSIYEPEIFNKRLTFDLVVYVSRNPALNEYLEKVVDKFLEILLTGANCGEGGKVNQLMVMLYDAKTNRDKERYTLKFNQFINLKPAIPTGESFKLAEFLAMKDQLSVIEIPNFTWEEIYSQFKYLLFQQQNELERKKLKKKEEIPIEQDLFFKVLMDVDESLPLDSKKEWVKVNSSGAGQGTGKIRFVPVAEVDTGFLSFGLQNEYVRN